MKKLQTTPIKDIELFHLILEAYHWDEVKTDTSTDANLYSNRPEATYNYATRNTQMVVKFHEPLNMISLWVADVRNPKQTLQLHFMYDEQPQRILEWIAAISDELTLDNYPILLKKARGKCEMMLLELANNKMYEVIPPTN